MEIFWHRVQFNWSSIQTQSLSRTPQMLISLAPFPPSPPPSSPFIVLVIWRTENVSHWNLLRTKLEKLYGWKGGKSVGRRNYRNSIDFIALRSIPFQHLLGTRKSPHPQIIKMQNDILYCIAKFLVAIVTEGLALCHSEILLYWKKWHNYFILSARISATLGLRKNRSRKIHKKEHNKNFYFLFQYY